MKTSNIEENWAGGYDLITQRDSGNPVRILTGKPECSRQFWCDMQDLAHQALKNIDDRERLQDDS